MELPVLEKFNIKHINMTQENNKPALTYQEAHALALTVEWEVLTCDEGEECWCRMINTKEKIIDENNDEIYIIPSGCLATEYAEHFVELHNQSLKN